MRELKLAILGAGKSMLMDGLTKLDQVGILCGRNLPGLSYPMSSYDRAVLRKSRTALIIYLNLRA